MGSTNAYCPRPVYQAPAGHRVCSVPLGRQLPARYFQPTDLSFSHSQEGWVLYGLSQLETVVPSPPAASTSAVSLCNPESWLGSCFLGNVVTVARWQILLVERPGNSDCVMPDTMGERSSVQRSCDRVQYLLRKCVWPHGNLVTGSSELIHKSFHNMFPDLSPALFPQTCTCAAVQTN